MPFIPSQTIGPYRLIRQLGRGGFGEVWLAEKTSQFLVKKVAVKLPIQDEVDLDAIRREAETWEKASGHPNVLPIIDAEIYDGQVVIVSEFADGGTLAERLKREGQLDPTSAVEMIVGVLNGLEFLHNRGIIHRDIKPQNILLQGGTPRLADFGISRVLNSSTVSSVIVGTDAYMAPEEFDGKRNRQTDIWSVGVVLYQLLRGSVPFDQQHPSERMFAVLTKDFPPLPTHIPVNLRRIVARCLSKQPDHRYQSAEEMNRDLRTWKSGVSLSGTLAHLSPPSYSNDETATRVRQPLQVPQQLAQRPPVQRLQPVYPQVPMRIPLLGSLAFRWTAK